MRPIHTAALIVLAFLAGASSKTAFGAETGGTAAADAVPTEDQIVVRGKALEQLRVRIERAENDVYSRFNDINSSDLHDMHCYERVRTGSRIKKRECVSNAWRKLDSAFGEATVRQMQSGSGGGEAPTFRAGETLPVSGAAGYSQSPAQYRANQLHTEKLVIDEMHQLARNDPDLAAAMVRLGQAYLAEEAATGGKPDWTVYREVPAGKAGLPFGAEGLFEVRIGDAPWSHPLTSRTFTFASVQGRIRDLAVDCSKSRARLDYRADAEWTVPESWGTCTLEVRGKRDTTFALYEFQ